MDISNILSNFSDAFWSLPFLLFFFGVCVFMTVYLVFVQFAYFKESVLMIFAPQKNATTVDASGTITPFQAFMNTLGGNIGNGSLAGIPVAIAVGGPGSIFWLLVMSTFSVSLRFAEVYLATSFSSQSTEEKSGPMYYLSLLPFGAVFSWLFGFFAFCYMMTGGNLIQCNAVGTALYRSWGISQTITACGVTLLVLYVVLGGAARIVKFLDKLVPIKVYGFLITALIVLAYHVTSIPHALYLMGYLAFSPQAFLGGTLAYAMQKSVALGLQQGINASEAGLGTAAVAFGTTKNQDPVKSGIMSMLSVYINTHLVCFLVALCVIASGVWDNGEISSALLVSAYETVFGSMGGWLVSVLVAMFATSVVVAYAYNGRICWEFLVGKKYAWLFLIVYPISAWYGTVMNARIVWTINSLVTGSLFLVHTIGLLYFASKIKNGLQEYRKKHG